MEEIKYSWAEPTDKNSIQFLLKKCELPSEDISTHLANFVVAKTGETIIGVNGIEIYGEDGLLRSLAVVPAFRGRGISRELNARILARAHQMGVKNLFLLTQTVENYAIKAGFHKIARDIVPESIRATLEFKSLCPQTAVCMMKLISGEIQYYPLEALQLKPDISGVKMWGVSLEKTMLTYFECEANCRFEKHSHESEQITLVLRGELFFDIGSEIMRVKQSEVIAIPSNVPHAVFTQGMPARACDAWSPVMPQYLRS
jgi:amino-acid N-acetyltransferase